MEYVNKDLGSYNLHMIKTDKFKTVTVRVIFRRQAKKDEMTIRNIVTKLMVMNTKNYKTKREMAIKSQDLYAAHIGVKGSRTGNFINTIFYLNVLNDKYTEEGNFKRGFDFLNDIIFNPNVEDGLFDKTYVNVVKNELRTEYLSFKEHANSYAMARCMEAYDKDSVASIRMGGYIEDLDTIEDTDLYKYYNEMINKDLVDIFVIGDIDFDNIYNTVKEAFNLRVLKKVRVPYYLDLKECRKKRLIAKETINNSQSVVDIICPYTKLSKYERDYVLPMYSYILGGGSDGKLFKEVREENSLCYTIAARERNYDGYVLIHTGIDKENYDKAIELIDKNMLDMRKGKFDLEDINVAYENFSTALDEIDNYPGTIMDYYMSMVFVGKDDIDTMRSNFRKVTKNDIVKVAKKIKIDTIYSLLGVKDEENGI